MYRIKFAPDYRDELADLEKRFPGLEQKLQGGVYFLCLGVAAVFSLAGFRSQVAVNTTSSAAAASG